MSEKKVFKKPEASSDVVTLCRWCKQQKISGALSDLVGKNIQNRKRRCSKFII